MQILFYLVNCKNILIKSVAMSHFDCLHQPEIAKNVFFVIFMKELHTNVDLSQY